MQLIFEALHTVDGRTFQVRHYTPEVGEWLRIEWQEVTKGRTQLDMFADCHDL